MKPLTDQYSLFTSALYQTNSTIIDLGKNILLVDPTWLPSEIDTIKSYIQEKYPNKILWIFITHFDYDHVWGAAAFRDAHIIAPSLVGLEYLGDKCLEQWKKWDQEHYINRPYPISLPVHEFVLFNDPELIWGDHSLFFYHVPGHTADSYCCVIEPEGILLAGDYLSDVEIPWIGHSLTSYKESLERFKKIVQKHQVKICIPGHGAIIHNYQAIMDRIKAGLTYLNLLAEHTKTSETAIQELISLYPFPIASQEIHDLNIKFAET